MNFVMFEKFGRTDIKYSASMLEVSVINNAHAVRIYSVVRLCSCQWIKVFLTIEPMHTISAELWWNARRGICRNRHWCCLDTSGNSIFIRSRRSVTCSISKSDIVSFVSKIVFLGGGVDVRLFFIYFLLFSLPQNTCKCNQFGHKSANVKAHKWPANVMHYICFRITSLASLMMVQTRRLMR